MGPSAATSKEQNLTDLTRIAQFAQALAREVQCWPADKVDAEFRQLIQTALRSLETACHKGHLGLDPPSAGRGAEE